MKQLALLSLLLCSPGFADTLYLSTGQAGANTQIDSGASSIWSFVPNTPIDLGGGIFRIKRGHDTVEDITLSLYQGIDASGLLLAAVTLNPDDVTQMYTDRNFFFSSVVTLLTGVSYFAALTSPASTQGDAQYFIKDQGIRIVDSGGNAIDPPPIDVGSIPEPSTFGLLGAAMLGLVVRRRMLRSRA